MAISDGKRLAESMPTLPGVYRFQGKEEQVLYVGKAKNLRKRVSSYFHSKKQSPRIALMLQAAETIDTIVTASEAEALLLENNLIKSLKPKYNILFRDDKSYPYLRLSKHPYPRLMFYRGKVEKDADYFGPFPDSHAVRETIDILQRVFRLRNCTDSVLATRTRPCLLHSIGRCSAPCTNAVTLENYTADAAQARNFLQGGAFAAESEMQLRMQKAAEAQQFEEAAVLRDRLRALAVVRSRHFADNNDSGDVADADYIGIHHNGSAACVNIIMVRGGRRVGEKRLFPDNANNCEEEQIVEALLTQHYRGKPPPLQIFIRNLPPDWQEIAPHLLTHIVEKPRVQDVQRMQMATDNARMALVNRGNQRANRQQHLVLLAQRLQLEKPPLRMECFDISHSMGEETVAARVVFKEGIAEKRAYRLFRIKSKTQGDDYAAIREAVGRCYRAAVADTSLLPDVLFIDGGVGQVSAALAAFEQLALTPPPLFGIAKGAARKPGEETLISAEGEALMLPATDSALHLIQAIRDEAHRFAITAHRRRRDKKRSTSSALEGIEGVGREKQRVLMTYFGGLSALRAASMSDLNKVSGIGRELAQRIYRALH
ncbi:MAG: excinuclease ABC subunit UvrC [Proteobacteria bacterium]|nr:excinuclease ABC subunit UvrC [Pseudomonadota bacterium]